MRQKRTCGAKILSFVLAAVMTFSLLPEAALAAEDPAAASYEEASEDPTEASGAETAAEASGAETAAEASAAETGESPAAVVEEASAAETGAATDAAPAAEASAAETEEASAFVFERSQELDGVIVTVKAGEGVFPEDASLSVSYVSEDEQEKVDAAVEAECEEGTHIAESYAYDIKMLDGEGNEIQPPEGQTVNVSFALAKAGDENLDAGIYHVKDAGENADGTEFEAERLETGRNEEAETLEAQTEGFSTYVLVFTYGNLYYVMGEERCYLSDICQTVGLEGKIENAWTSNDLKLKALYDSSEYVIIRYVTDMELSETLSVVIGGTTYEIRVTDGLRTNTWNELKQLIKDAPDNKDTFIMLTENISRPGKDTADDKDMIVIPKNKVITLDLNGCTIDTHRSHGWDGDAIEQTVHQGHCLEVQKGGRLTLKDSGTDGEGTITGGNSFWGGGLYIDEGGECTIEDVTFSGNYGAGRGGAIYVNGILTMTGGKIKENYTMDGGGGGIYCDTKGTIQLDGVEITENYARTNTNDDGYSQESKNGGGGLYLKIRNDNCYIKNCTINNNQTFDQSTEDKGRTDYGGGLYLEASDKTLTVENTSFDGNSSHDFGGGIYVDKGTINMTGGTISANKCHMAGGGVYIGASGVFNAQETELNGNVVDRALSSDENGGYGAGIFLENQCSLRGCTVKGNDAYTYGGGIYQKSGSLTMIDTTVTENNASLYGGLYMATDLTAGGNTVVTDNTSTDVYLKTGKKIIISDEKLGSKANIGVALQSSTGTFTTGFTTVMGESDTPDTYFFSNEYLVTKHEDEGYLMADLDEAHKFLKRPDRIQANVSKLGTTNWMAGISGERYLNEINMPGTHDSSMRNVSHKGCPTGKIGALFAKTQRAYLDEQFSQGARYIDLRINNEYCSSEIAIGHLIMGLSAVTAFIPACGPAIAGVLATIGYLTLKDDAAIPIFKDDGENLWLCHGKTAAGTFYALDPRDHNLSLKQELDWIKEFLENHPTETIIINFQPESQDLGDDAPVIRSRLKGMLEKLSTETNPSTGEPYVYWEDGKICQLYTHWPQLKDCRGKIVPMGDKNDIAVFGGLGSGLPAGGSEIITTERPEGSYKDAASEKIKNLTAFFKDRNVPIPRDAHKENGLTVRYSVGTNGTDEGHLQRPLDVADQVIPAVFGEEKVIGSNKIGIHIGWFGMDGAYTKIYRNVWITNFPDDLDYCVITVKAGLGAADVPDQTYKVLRGTPITIPGCIYDGEQADKFLGWKADLDNQIYIQNDDYTVEQNVTFTAQWSDQPQSPVEIVWKDVENLDGIRPDALTIVYNESYTETITVEDNWTIMLSGNITGGPSVKDVPDGYTANVEGKQGKDGYTITMTHTPDVSVDASGSVIWDDQDNADGVRPDSVTLRLFANDEEMAKGTASADDGWTFDLGIYPRYRDGELVAYRLVEDEIAVDETIMANGYSNGVEEKAGDKGAIEGYTVTNRHDPTTTMVYARIQWDDNDNEKGARPESVKIRWLKNGKVLSEETVTEGEEGLWEFGLEVPYSEIRKIGEEQDALAEKYKKGELTEEELIEALKKTVTFDLEQDSIDGYTTTITLKQHSGSEVVDGEDEEEDIAGAKATYYLIVNKYENHEHSLTETPKKDPTCTENGNTAYWTCDGGDHPCGKFFSDAEGENEIEKDSWVIPATGHKWGDASYTWTEDNSSVTAKRICQNNPEHVETETVKTTSKVTKKPTCTENGETTFTASFTQEHDGGFKFGEQTKALKNVPATGHKWGDWTVTKEPKVMQKGETQRVCQNDSSHVQTKPVPALKVRGVLLAKMNPSGKNALKITWTKVENVEGYDIFWGPCSGKVKKVKTIEGNETFSFKKAKLKNHTPYKAYIRAWVMVDGSKKYLRKSFSVHSFTGGYQGDQCNAKSITVSRTEVSLKVGKTTKIKAEVQPAKPDKVLMSTDHCARVRYKSSNKKIASINSKGRITGNAKGTCKIYVYAHNGQRKTVTVTVK